MDGIYAGKKKGRRTVDGRVIRDMRRIRCEKLVFGGLLVLSFQREGLDWV